MTIAFPFWGRVWVKDSESAPVGFITYGLLEGKVLIAIDRLENGELTGRGVLVPFDNIDRIETLTEQEAKGQ